MQNNEILGLFGLVIAIGYRYWAFKQSVPILPHRRLTFWYLLVFVIVLRPGVATTILPLDSVASSADTFSPQ